MDRQDRRTLAQMTLEEKVAMAAGSDMWHSTGVERLGIPPFKVTDGPNGARGEGMPGGGSTSACFPVGIAWRRPGTSELIERVGRRWARRLSPRARTCCWGRRSTFTARR